MCVCVCSQRISLVSSFAASLFLGGFAPIDYSDGDAASSLVVTVELKMMSHSRWPMKAGLPLWGPRPSEGPFREALQRGPSERPFRGALQRGPSERPFRGALQRGPSERPFRAAIQRGPSEGPFRGALQRGPFEGPFRGALRRAPSVLGVLTAMRLLTPGSGMNLLDIRTRTWSGVCMEATAPHLDRLLGAPVPSTSVLVRLVSAGLCWSLLVCVDPAAP